MSPATQHDPAPTPARRGWRTWDGMVWLIIGIFAMVLGANAIMITVAVDGSPNLVREDYYQASKQIDAELALRRESVRSGWKVGVAPTARDAVTVQAVTADGQPLQGLTGAVYAYRPSDAALDQQLPLQPLGQAPGSYRAVFARPAAGLWRVTVQLHDGQGTRFEQTHKVVLP